MQNSKNVNILLIGENSEDFSTLSQIISSSEQENYKYHTYYADNLHLGLAKLSEARTHIVLLDLPLGGYQGLEPFLQVWDQSPTIPIIVLVSQVDEAFGVAAVANGALDYVVKDKGNEAIIKRVIRYALERKHLEAETKKQLEASRRLMHQAQLEQEMKGKFLAYVSHEIRAPMNAVLGFAHLLAKTPLDDKQKEYISAITSSGQLILKVISDILDITRIDAGQLKLERIDFDVRKLVEDVFKIVRTISVEKSISLNYVIDDSVPQVLNGDQYRLNQILINLLNNSIKFTDEGEVSLNVRLKADGGDEKLSDKELLIEFEVVDTGIGIAKDQQAIIFEAFKQVSLPENRKSEGLGLGLAISKRLVEAMGGRVWVNSEIDKGSTFTFTVVFHQALKVGPVVVPDDQDDAPLAKTKECAGIKVLVAEDSIASQDLMKEYFSLFGCDGEYVSDGKEALEKIKNNIFDLCLMDVELPGMGGLDVTKKVRSELKNDIPIIALTASAMVEDRKRCLSAGMNDYITKPIEMDDLKDKIIQYGKK